MGQEYGVDKLCKVPVICASAGVVCLEKTEAGNKIVTPSIGKITSIPTRATKGNSPSNRLGRSSIVGLRVGSALPSLAAGDTSGRI